jgi:hypothetical protein
VPIDFAAVAQTFSRAFRLQVKPITLTFERLAKSLGTRLKSAQSLERASSGFPVVVFYNEALTLRLHDSQRGALELNAPPPTLGEHLLQGGRSFVEGFTQIADMIEQELALPRFAASLDRGLAIVEASIARWMNVTARHFDRGPRTASDLFGELALAFRMVADASHRDDLAQLFSALSGTLVVGPEDGDLWHLIDQLGRARDIISGGGGGGEGGAGAGELVPEIPLSETLDSYAFLLLGGTMTIGTLPRFIELLLRTAVLRLKVFVLDVLISIETLIEENVRQKIFDLFFVDVPQLLARAYHFLGGVQVVVTDLLTAYATFARDYLTELLDAGIPFIQRVLEFVRDLVTAIRAIPPALLPALNYDLRWFLLKDGSTAGMVIVRYLPRLTLNELLDENGTAVNRDLHRRLLEAMIELRQDFGILFLSDDVSRKWATAVRLFQAMFPPSAAGLAEAPAFEFESRFPAIGETLFGSGRREALELAVLGLESSLRTGVTELFDGLSTGVEAVARDLEDSSGRAAVLGSLRRYRRIAGQTDSMAEGFFGPEVRTQRELLAARPPDDLGRAYERWLASGGFVLIGSVIPVYVREMRDYWLEHVRRGTEPTAPVTPTSPRILRQRARVGRVNVPRVRLHARRPARLDAEFARAVAQGFERAVGRAYVNGRDRLREMAEMEP